MSDFLLEKGKTGIFLIKKMNKNELDFLRIGLIPNQKSRFFFFEIVKRNPLSKQKT